LLPVLDELRAIDAVSKENAQKAAAQRQLDRSPFPTASAPAKRQRTLDECKAAVSKAECNEALAQWAFVEARGDKGEKEKGG